MKNQTTRTTGHERMIYLSAIAAKDKEIDDLKWSHRQELAEKDKTIAYYQKTAAQATDRKQRAIRNAERRAKLNFSYAALIVAAMTVIPWALWLIDLAMKSFFLWTQGR